MSRFTRGSINPCDVGDDVRRLIIYDFLIYSLRAASAFGKHWQIVIRKSQIQSETRHLVSYMKVQNSYNRTNS